MVSLLTAIGAGVLAVATYGGYRGLRWVGRYVRFTRASTSATGQVRSPGFVEVTGTVDADPPFESPVGDEACVIAQWTVEEHSTSMSAPGWKTVGSGAYAVPFEVDDGSGSVTVDLRERTGDGAVAARWPEFLEGGSRVAPDVVHPLGDVEVAETRARWAGA